MQSLMRSFASASLQRCTCNLPSTSSTLLRSSNLRIPAPTSIRSFSSTTPVSGNIKIKIKTHKGTAKRWTPLANGQYKRGRPGKRHLNVSLSPSRLNKLGQTAYASPAQQRMLKRLLPGQ